jgi:hypothetical protein
VSHLSNLLRDKTLYHCQVKKRDRKLFRAKTWEVFNLVYDQDDLFVSGAYVCGRCFEPIVANFNAEGNNKLTRHICFKAWLVQKTAAEKKKDAKRPKDKNDESYGKY